MGINVKRTGEVPSEYQNQQIKNAVTQRRSKQAKHAAQANAEAAVYAKETEKNLTKYFEAIKPHIEEIKQEEALYLAEIQDHSMGKNEKGLFYYETRITNPNPPVA